jgi:hypothetical protein
MAYTKTTWADGPGGATPINAANLQNIEDGIEVLEGQSLGVPLNKVFGDAGGSVAAFDKIFVNTVGGAFNLVLPAAPANGAVVNFIDVKGNFATANFTINVPAGVNFMGVVDDFLLLVANYDYLEVTYFMADDNWIITNKP